MAQTIGASPTSSRRNSKSSDRTFDIVVIGNGVTALNCLWQLKKRGYQKIGWSTQWPIATLLKDLNRSKKGQSTTTTSWRSSGAISCFPLDHLTRYTHRLGLKVGKDVWAINRLGMDSIRDICRDQELPITQGILRSYALTDSEFKELAACSLQSPRSEGVLDFKHESNKNIGHLETLGCLTHPLQSSGLIEIQTLAKRLINEFNTYLRIPPITNLDSDSSGLLITCAKHRFKIRAQMVVVACHTQTAHLLPSLSTSLIPVVDQWNEFSMADSNACRMLEPGDFFKLNYGQTWGFLTNDLKLRIGGSRFLRDWKDHLQANSLPHTKVTDFHTKIWRQIAGPSNKPLTANSHKMMEQKPQTTTQAYVDILPCDELPIIGPMSHDPRILVATGFYGFGLPLATLAGTWLTQIIDEGKAPGLLSCFLPNRLRSLSD